MKKTCLLPLALVLLAPALTIARSIDLLPQWAGEWTSVAEINLEPGKPPFKSKGTEKSRMIGKFWLVSEGQSDVMGMPYSALTTLGFDEKTKKFVGTTIDSFTQHQWRYEGTADATGKILTMEGEGPDPTDSSKKIRVREVYELKTKDHKVFTTYSLEADGKWQQMVKIDFTRTR